MNEKQKKVLQVLQKASSPMTGKQIASQLRITPRTVINYVNAINAEAKEPLILSSQQGYSYSGKAGDSTARETDIPQNTLQRSMTLVKRLLIDSPQGMNAFDAADELLVSYSQLKKEITQFNQQWADMNVSIISRNNMLSIDGKEQDKRRLFTNMVRFSQEGNILTLDQLKKYFGDSCIDTICQILDEHLSNADVYINDFSRLNLVFHIAVAISRVQKGNTLVEAADHPHAPLTSLETTAEEIIHDIGNQFSITLNSSDETQLLALIESHTHSADDAGISTEYVDRDTLSVLRDIMSDVKTVYYIDFNDDEFLVPFSLHMQNLIIRLKQDIHIENPIKETFRNNSPFLYDIAVYIMQKVLSIYAIPFEMLNEDELTFVVMHLAIEMQRQKQNDDAVRVLLFLPKYLQLETAISSKIQLHFEDQIRIVGIASLEDDITSWQYDVLFTCVDVKVPSGIRSVKISPMLSQNDWTSMNNVITQIQQNKSFQYFINVFPFYFDEKNFIRVEKAGLNRDEAISLLCRRLEKTGYAVPGFKEAVLQREHAISTGYLNFAVPHAVNSTVSSETVGILVAPHGIIWQNRTAYVVLMMAIQPDNLENFQKMYNALLLLLLETNIVDQLKNSRDFNEFRQAILKEASGTR